MSLDGPLPPDPLPEVPLPELLARARSVADTSSLMETRGRLMVALQARGLSWRQIETETGIPRATANRWARKYLTGR